MEERGSAVGHRGRGTGHRGRGTGHREWRIGESGLEVGVGVWVLWEETFSIFQFILPVMANRFVWLVISPTHGTSCTLATASTNG